MIVFFLLLTSFSNQNSIPLPRHSENEKMQTFVKPKAHSYGVVVLSRPSMLENCTFPLDVSSIQAKYSAVFIGNNSHNISWIQPSVLFVSLSTQIHCAATMPFEFPLPWHC